MARYISNVISLREGTVEKYTKYYMLLTDIISIRECEDNIDKMMSILSDDQYCHIDDILGKRHTLYFSDVKALNNNNMTDYKEFFTLLVNSWMFHRESRK